MPLDPAVARSIAHLFDATLAEVLRGEVPGVPAAATMTRDDVFVTEAEVPGPAGTVAVRLYRRSDAAALGPRAPVLAWVHGGGWAYGDLAMPEADSVAQLTAAALGIVVVSIDYRKAPAHRYPAAVDDVRAAVDWIVAHAETLGVDPARMALGGASAGAHIALGVAAALAGRESRTAAAAVSGHAASMPVELAAMWLAYPVIDPVGGPYPDERHVECPAVLWLDRDAMTAMFERYVGAIDDGAIDAVPTVDALGSVRALRVAVAECDALAPQGRAFAAHAASAGVATSVVEVGGVIHGYLNTVGDSAVADRALVDDLDWLRSVLCRADDLCDTGAEAARVPNGPTQAVTPPG